MAMSFTPYGSNVMFQRRSCVSASFRIVRPNNLAVIRRSGILQVCRAESTTISTYAYTSLSLLTAAHIALQILVPAPFTHIPMSGASPTFICESLVRFSAATTVPAAAALWCLKDASEHNRLGSDTYKRLNLGLISWQSVALGLTLVTQGLYSIWYTSALIGYSAAVILLCGHAYTEHSGTGFGEPLLEAGKGTLASAKMLFKNGSVYSTIFSFVTVMAPLVGMTFLLDPMTFFQPSVFRSGVGLLGMRLMQSVGCNMLFASPIFYCLKDAEDRGRSGASTFRLLSIAAMSTGLAEIGIFLTAGVTSDAIREVVFCTIMASFLLKARSKQ